MQVINRLICQILAQLMIKISMVSCSSSLPNDSICLAGVWVTETVRAMHDAVSFGPEYGRLCCWHGMDSKEVADRWLNNKSLKTQNVIWKTKGQRNKGDGRSQHPGLLQVLAQLPLETVTLSPIPPSPSPHVSPPLNHWNCLYLPPPSPPFFSFFFFFKSGRYASTVRPPTVNPSNDVRIFNTLKLDIKWKKNKCRRNHHTFVQGWARIIQLSTFFLC